MLWSALLLVLATGLQAAPQPPVTEGLCPQEQECISAADCPAFVYQRGLLASLEEGSSAHRNLVTELKTKVCDSTRERVCCANDFELSNGNKVTDPAEFPFLAFIHVRHGIRGSTECGASLIQDKYLISSKHCLQNFEKSCDDIENCYVEFRNLHKILYEPGEIRIPIFDVILGPGTSDLALIQLQYPVREHEDYKTGEPFVPVNPVTLATEAPKPGEKVITGGWGRLGFDEAKQRTKEFSDSLMSLELTVTRVDSKYIYTNVFTNGVLTDACEGKSVQV